MALKINVPSNPTGNAPVGDNDYQSGQVAALDSTGAACLAGTEAAANTNGTRNIAVGVFGEDHLTANLQSTSQAKEELILASGVAVPLAHDALVANSQRVALKSDDTTVLVAGVDYTISAMAGTVTSTGTKANGTVVTVSYTFNLNDKAEKDFRGQNFRNTLDDVDGSGKSTVWKGYAEIETDQFVTSRAYAISDQLRYTHSSHALGAGKFTNEAGGSTVVDVIVGRVLSVPTAANPFLGVAWTGPDATDIP
jgi:hypothetical protein